MNFFGLQREFWWAHLLAFRLHDTLLNCFLNGEQEGVFHLSIPYVKGEEGVIEKDHGGDVMAWLESTGRHAEVKSLEERAVVHSLLPDICQFLFESLECAAKGKLAVAFALLRKPCRDQLFVLEWILAERDSFLSEFSVGPENIDLCQLLKKRQDWMKSTSKQACELSAHSHFSDFELLWELRFDKSVAWSMEGPWNQAIHLVTTQKHYTTPVQGLNYGFMDEDDRSEALRHYYEAVPLLLAHIVGVVRALLLRWNPKFRTVGSLFDLGILANVALAQLDVVKRPESTYAIESINELIDDMKVVCQSCGKPLKVHGTIDLEHFVADLIIPCHSCGHMDRSMIELEEFMNSAIEDDPEPSASSSPIVDLGTNL